MFGSVYCVVGVVLLFGFVLVYYAWMNGFSDRGTTTSPNISASWAQQAAYSDSLIDEMHVLALEAMHEAQLDPAWQRIVVMDLGVLAYVSPGQTPIVCREAADLPAGTRYLRPFAVLRRRSGPAKAQVGFRLQDGQDSEWFRDSAQAILPAADAFIYATNWLPLRDPNMVDSAWELLVFVNGDLLAVHIFEWATGGGPILRYLSGDGELSGVLVRTMRSSKMGKVSLDELLGR